MKEINLYKNKFISPHIELNSEFLNKNTINLFKHTNKIIIRGVAKRLTACLDTRGSGLLVAVHAVIPSDNQNTYYILGLINSKLLNWFHLHTYYSVRIPQGSLKYPVDCISTLPIPDPKIYETEFREITNLVSKIFEHPNNINKLKKQIDLMVYKLYGLTEEQIKIVEGKV